MAWENGRGKKNDAFSFGMPDYICANDTTNGKKGGALGTTTMTKEGRRKET